MVLPSLPKLTSGQVADRLIDQFKEFSNVIFFNTRKGDTQVGAVDGDGADSIVIEQMQS